jgi:hypothetical protein
MVSTPRLASELFLLWLDARVDTLLVSPGSPATSAGYQQKLALLLFNKHNNGDTKSEAQKHSLIFLNQSYEVMTSGEDKVACNNFVI